MKTTKRCSSLRKLERKLERKRSGNPGRSGVPPIAVVLLKKSVCPEGSHLRHGCRAEVQGQEARCPKDAHTFLKALLQQREHYST